MIDVPNFQTIKISDPQLRRELIEYLKTFLLPQRLEKIETVLSQRTRYVTVAVEDLFQTQNISAVVRSCECYGIQDIHIVNDENECQLHKAITMGANKWLTLNYYDNQEEKGIVSCIESLKNRGYSVIATVPRENAIAIEELSTENPVAFVFGTELTGLTQEAIDLADVAVKIPMYGFTESFNISNSVAIILSQFTEKLRKSGKNIALSTEEKEELLFEWLQKAVKSSDLLIDNFIVKKNR